VTHDPADLPVVDIFHSFTTAGYLSPQSSQNSAKRSSASLTAAALLERLRVHGQRPGQRRPAHQGASCDWLAQSTVPKLFINGDPGMGLTGARRDFVRTWPVQREVAVPGLHFLQEDSPDEIGRAVAAWIATLP